MCVLRLLNGQKFCRVLLYRIQIIVRVLHGFRLDDLQALITLWHLYREDSTMTLRIVLHDNFTLMQSHQHGSKVHANASADISILMLSRVEALENFLFILILDAHTCVYHLQLEVLTISCQANGDFSTIGCELKGIRQQVHHNLVHVVGIHIDRHLFHFMFKRVGDASVLCTCNKHIIDILQEFNQFHLMIVEQELTLLYLPHIHHLVDESQDSF